MGGVTKPDATGDDELRLEVTGEFFDVEGGGLGGGVILWDIPLCDDDTTLERETLESVAAIDFRGIWCCCEVERLTGKEVADTERRGGLTACCCPTSCRDDNGERCPMALRSLIF